MPDLLIGHKIVGGNFHVLPIICALLPGANPTVIMAQKTAAYGTWISPISADLVAGQSLRLDQVQCAGDVIYWSELRPAEQGRNVIVGHRRGDAPFDVIPAPFSARSRVHEYGGGAFLACEGEVFFVNEKDQGIYRAVSGAEPELVALDAELRCADFALDPIRRRLVAIAEEHDPDGIDVPENMLVDIPLEGPGAGVIEPFVSGRDFYAYPRFNHDGTQMCWVEWDLPWMPWEDARLMVGAVGEDGGIERMAHIAGGDGANLFQPEWGADGRLYFVSDVSGWGNLYVWDGTTVEPVLLMDAEFGRPPWGLRTTSFAVTGAQSIVASYIDHGVFKLAGIDASNGTMSELVQSFAQIDSICPTPDGVGALTMGNMVAPSVVRLSIAGNVVSAPEVLRSAMTKPLDPGSISQGRLIQVPLQQGGPIHAVYYPPTNAGFCGVSGTAPPLIAAAHGGPTGMADRGLKLKIQYWTSRGFAFVDVDYRGSAGYGKAYRDALNGQWGLVDVDDVIAASRWLVDQGLADGERLLISGGSAGGYTVLSALTFHDVFAAGASYYGIGDLQKLLDLTHKFESGYIYNLTGTAPGETDAVFQARSPLFHAEQISSPVIFFQGIEDKVVPPGQSREMVEALRRQNIPVAYLEFEGEGHGFRRSETIVAALNSEYAFYARVLGLEPQEELPGVHIHNEGSLK